MTEDSLAPGAAAHILVVDDDPAMRMLVCEALQVMRYRVLEAPDLPGARQLLAKAAINLVLLDIRLRESDSGTVLLRELTPRSPDVAVVMMTANSSVEIAIECLRDGAFDYLLKP